MTGDEMRYPLRVLGPDYVRAAAGLGLTAGPLALVPAAPVVAAVLGGMATLFAVFAVRTALRHVTVITLDDDGVVIRGPMSRRLQWGRVRGMKLAYFALRRDRQRGWMQLRLRGDHGGLTVDSGIDRFPEIVRLAYRAARRNGVRLSETTLANVATMGLAIDDGDGAAGS